MSQGMLMSEVLELSFQVKDLGELRTIELGDLAGHEFHGNQYTSMAKLAKAAQAVTNKAPGLAGTRSGYAWDTSTKAFDMTKAAKTPLGHAEASAQHTQGSFDHERAAKDYSKGSKEYAAHMAAAEAHESMASAHDTKSGPSVENIQGALAKFATSTGGKAPEVNDRARELANNEVKATNEDHESKNSRVRAWAATQKANEENTAGGHKAASKVHALAATEHPAFKNEHTNAAMYHRKKAAEKNPVLTDAEKRATKVSKAREEAARQVGKPVEKEEVKKPKIPDVVGAVTGTTPEQRGEKQVGKVSPPATLESLHKPEALEAYFGKGKNDTRNANKTSGVTHTYHQEGTKKGEEGHEIKAKLDKMGHERARIATMSDEALENRIDKITKPEKLRDFHAALKEAGKHDLASLVAKKMKEMQLSSTVTVGGEDWTFGDL